MAGDACTCGVRFMTAEDWRDHMPCDGSPLEQAARAQGVRDGLELAAKYHEERARFRDEEASFFKEDGDSGAARIHRAWAAGHRGHARRIRLLKKNG